METLFPFFIISCILPFMTQKTKSYDSVTVNKLDKSRVELTGSIPTETWEKYREEALKHINESITVDGFRKGNIPENILVSKVGEMAVLEEMAEHALSHAYVDIVIDNKLDAIGRPEIHITKIAKGNPLEFKITTAVVPEVSLPDYKKIAAEKVSTQNPEEEKFTDKEMEDTLKRIQEDAKLPELTDNTVAQVGAFSSVSELKTKVGEMLTEQKKSQAQDKRRIAIADAILEKSKVDMPDVLIESEINRIQGQFIEDLEKMNVKLDDYMKHAKKTLEEIRKEWRQPAEKKAKLQLILNAIAQKENITPDPKEVEHEVKHITDHYKDADKEKAKAYAETVLTNEKVFQFLEDGK
jgi:FKBP-type peptidyl-prolyl cis-trans isomerase (trigger factor)